MGKISNQVFLTADFDGGVVSHSPGPSWIAYTQTIFIACLFKSSDRSETRCRARENSRKSIWIQWTRYYNDNKKIRFER